MRTSEDLPNPAPTAASAIAAAAGEPPNRTVQFISFRVGDQQFATDIMAVREIKGWTDTTTLPNQPEYLLGVLNLRGTIVPIYDLRCRFGLGLTTATRTHVVIIVSVMERTIGLLVDAVSDIITIKSSEIRPVPEMDRATTTNYLSGLISVGDSMVVLLSLETLFAQSSQLDTSTLAA
ncbi:MAG: chemotaxis protein CheW [Ancalomicrobiaceae bacterium]|nr:chemotaxis protein CheW [Ancalomicrobiaceae bacterium]